MQYVLRVLCIGLQSARESLNLNGSKDDDSNRFLEALWAAGAADESILPSTGIAGAWQSTIDCC